VGGRSLITRALSSSIINRMSCSKLIALQLHQKKRDCMQLQQTRFIYSHRIADRGTTKAFPPSCAGCCQEPQAQLRRNDDCHSALGRLKEGVTSGPQSIEVTFTIPALVPNPQNNPRLQASPTASCDDHSPGNWIGTLMKRGRGTIRVAHTFHEVAVHRRSGGTFATMSSP
jgi:hypothetical protein